MLRSSTTSYYETDGLGSVTSLTNSSGTPAETYTYDSLGNTVATTGSLTNPFRYTGQELDAETGLYYYRARYFDPNAGRFLSEDPLRFGGGDDFYVYAENDFANFVDPYGLQAQPKFNPLPKPTPTPGRPFVVPKTPPPPESLSDIIIEGIEDFAKDAGGVVAVVLSSSSDLNPDEDEQIAKSRQRQNEYQNYKKRCDEPPPSGLNPCDLANWQLQRNIDCMNMRKAWDDRWQPGRHADDIENLDRSIKNLKDWIRKNCKNECIQ